MKTVEGMKAMLPDLVFSEIRVEGVAATFLESLYDCYTGLYELEEFVAVLKHIAIRKCPTA